MDWVCEPWVVAGTGLSVADHQRRTVENDLDLAARAPDLPWVPVVQGWSPDECLRHLDAYAAAGADLAARRRPGPGPGCVGSHARRNNCLAYALTWRGRLLRAVDLDEPDAAPATQPRLFPVPPGGWWAGPDGPPADPPAGGPPRCAPA